MTGDYSNVPITVTLTNNTEYNIPIELRDLFEQVPAVIEAGQTLILKVQTSDALAVITHRAGVTDLEMNVTEEDIEQGGSSEVTKTLTSITITQQPTKTTYTESENFSTDGMIVTANYSDNSTADVTSSIEVEGGTNLQLGTLYVTIKYTEGSVTASATVNVVIEEAIVSVTSVTLDNNNITLVEGGTQQLTATVNPTNASNQNVSWSSSATEIATVENGLVTAVAEGTAVITVTTEDGSYTDTCNVTVTAVSISVTGVSLNKNSLELEEEDTETLVATIIPDNATNTNIVWSTENSAIATVENGLVTAIAEGSTIITVTTEDGSFTDSCTVIVSAKVISVTDVTLDQTSIEITEEDTQQLTATVFPENATDTSVVWSSENSSVATVSQEGLVTAVSEGTTTITVTTNDGGKTAICNVVVNAKVINVTGVSLDKNSLELVEEDTETLIATVAPDDATNKNVIWSTENSGIATVNDGVVTAVSVGNTTITVTTEDGSYTDTCSVVVTAKIINVDSVTLNKTSTTLIEGNSEQLTYTISPENATDQSVSWSTDNSSVATVTDGLVEALTPGTANITITTTDGGKTDTCEVTVESAVVNVESISLNKNATTLTEEDTEQLTYTITPENATNQSVTWLSDDTEVATVTDGLITAVSAGTANITVTTTDGSKTDTCVVTVEAKVVNVDGVSLSDTNVNLIEGNTYQITATISPENATDNTVTWTSDDEQVATIDGSGRIVNIVAVGAGTTNITVTTKDGSFTDTCTVNVEAATVSVTSVTLSTNSLEMEETDVETLVATVSPENATNQTITWTSSNSEVATVNEGVITAVKSGTAVITVTTEDGSFTDTCNVVVTEKEVSSVDDLSNAITNGATNVVLTSNITVNDSELNLGNVETFDGGSNIITFTTTGSNLVVGENTSTVQNVVIENTAELSTSVDTYGIQVTNNNACTLDTVTVSGCDVGIVLNNSTVTLNGTINVSSNEGTGIELINSSVLNIGSATLVNSTEEYGIPTISTDTNQTITGADSLYTVQIEDAIQYYINEDNTVNPNQTISDINIMEKVKAFCNKYYNNYANTTIETTSEDFDSDIVYINLGQVVSDESEIQINGETYDTTEVSLSIGNNGFLKAPLWKIENKVLYVSTFTLGVNTTENEIIVVCGNITKTITDTNSIPATTLPITQVYALNTQDGYTNSVTTNDNNTEIVHDTEHGLHLVGVVVQDSESQDILDESIYYLYHSELSSGISTPETIEQQITFGMYGKYSTEPYTQDQVEQRVMNITLLIPDKGATQFKLTVNCMYKEDTGGEE